MSIDLQAIMLRFCAEWLDANPNASVREAYMAGAFRSFEVMQTSHDATQIAEFERWLAEREAEVEAECMLAYSEKDVL